MSFKKYVLVLAAVVVFLRPLGLWAQAREDSTLQNVSLDECINFAMRNQPAYQQALLDQEINDRTIHASLSSWLPQIRSEFNLNHYFALPYNFVSSNLADPTSPKRAVRFGYPDFSNLLFQADQTLYSNDLSLAARGARYSRLQASQNAESAKINVVVNVSKAYYDILLTQEQLNVLNEDINRLQKLVKDSYNRYQGGLTDKIDYKRANITLNNSNSQRKSIEEALKYKYSYLKQLMGYPTEKDLSLKIDTLQMAQELSLDTLEQVKYEDRIEYQLLKTQVQLQTLNAKYYRNGFLPTVTAFVNYNFVYTNNSFAEAFQKNYPNSAVGLKIAVPLFQGGKRLYNLQSSKLQIKRLEMDLKNAKAQINTQYEQALAVYKANLTELRNQSENLEVAREVYNTVKLQYDEGVKTYLDVITSETDLRTSQLNYFNAMFNVLSSKLDVQKSMGNVNTNR